MGPPDWLNSEFLTSSLEAEGGGKVDLLEYVIEPAVPEGYNWFSSLYRVILKFRKADNGGQIKRTSLIVKAISNIGLIKQYTIDLKFFEHEFYVYNEVLPEIHRCLGDETLSPKKMFSLNDSVLVLEDLRASGYTVVVRMKQLGYDHTLSYIRQLAKFHAGTVALHEKNPDRMEAIGKELMFTEVNKDDVHGKYYTNCLMLTVEALESIGGHDRFCKKIRCVKDTLWDTVVGLMETEKHVRVLNHGDASLMNVLYKHDIENRTVTDARLIDYQLIRYASPAIDLHYLFMTSVRPEVIWNRFDELLDAYRETFNAMADKMNAETRLSAEQLEDELKFAGKFALMIACSLMPMIIADPVKPSKISNDSTSRESEVILEANVNPIVKIYENEQFKLVIVELLTFLEQRGYF